MFLELLLANHYLQKKLGASMFRYRILMKYKSGDITLQKTIE
jgi:hypothetical protein